MDTISYFEENLTQIDSVIRAICVRHSIYGDEAEEFASIIKLKLIEDDYRKIRDFKGRSSLKTYLYAVISRLFIDELRSKKGRWRPSAHAKKLGKAAMLIEELVYRDNHSFDEACQIIQSNHSLSCSKDELYDIYLKLPRRESSHLTEVDPECLPDIRSADPLPDEMLHRRKMDEIKSKIERMIGEILASLSEEDRLILRMRFNDDISISMMADTLRQKRAYVENRIGLILAGFKEAIISAGININDAMDVIKHIEVQ